MRSFPHRATTANVKFDITFIAIMLLGIGGWIANIVKLFGTSFDPLTAMAVLRMVGIFIPPLGAIFGYL